MDITHEASVGIAIVSLLGTITTAVLSFLDKKNARETDVQLALLKDENEELRQKLDECKKQHDESEHDRSELWRKLTAAEARLEQAVKVATQAGERIAELEKKLGAK